MIPRAKKNSSDGLLAVSLAEDLTSRADLYTFRYHCWNKPTMASYNPPTRPEHIDTLISGVDRYNPHNLSHLHEYLDAQLRGEYEWDCMAALAILKL